MPTMSMLIQCVFIDGENGEVISGMVKEIVGQRNVAISEHQSKDDVKLSPLTKQQPALLASSEPS